MKKALIYIVSLLVIGGAVNVVYHNPGVNVNSILAMVMIVFFGIVGSISAWRNKTVPNYERAACFLSALSIAAFVKALSYQLDGVTFLDWVALLVLVAGIILLIVHNPEDNADDDVTVVVTEDNIVESSIEFPEGATILALDKDGNPELDEDGRLQFFDDEGHRIYGVSALGTVTKITDDSIVITKEDGSTITVHSNGSVEGDIPDSLYVFRPDDTVAKVTVTSIEITKEDGSTITVNYDGGSVEGDIPDWLYVPHPDNKEGWRNVYQGIRERLEERPDEDK